MLIWSENLPEHCPPEKAIDPEGLVLYRLCSTTKPTEEDFFSQRAICPNCNFKGISECIAHSLSVWDNEDYCINLLKLPRHKGKSTMKLVLKSSDGLVLQTFKPNHYSWWKTQSFDLKTIEILK